MNLPFGRAKRRSLTPQINLYPEDPFYASLMGKVLKWAVSVGRHIIIFTELVVIGSFASRFVLDRQLSDLNTDIVQKQAVVESYGTLEDDFRALQKRSQDIQSILDEQGKYQVLERLETLSPPDIRFDQISFSNNTLNVRGTALSNLALSQLVDGLRQDSSFTAVTINNIRGGDVRDPSIQFALSAQSTFGPSPTPTPGPATRRPAASQEPGL